MYRVMIVEDDDIIAGTVKKHLEQWQYDVHIAADLSNVMGEFTDYSPLVQRDTESLQTSHYVFIIGIR